MTRPRDTHPPLGFQCRCTPTLLPAAWFGEVYMWQGAGETQCMECQRPVYSCVCARRVEPIALPVATVPCCPQCDRPAAPEHVLVYTAKCWWCEHAWKKSDTKRWVPVG